MGQLHPHAGDAPRATLSPDPDRLRYVRLRLHRVGEPHREGRRTDALPGPGQAGGVGEEPHVPPGPADDDARAGSQGGMSRRRTRSVHRRHPGQATRRSKPPHPNTSTTSADCSSTPSPRKNSTHSAGSRTASSRTWRSSLTDRSRSRRVHGRAEVRPTPTRRGRTDARAARHVSSRHPSYARTGRA